MVRHEGAVPASGDAEDGAGRGRRQQVSAPLPQLSSGKFRNETLASDKPSPVRCLGAARQPWAHPCGTAPRGSGPSASRRHRHRHRHGLSEALGLAAAPLSAQVPRVVAGPAHHPALAPTERLILSYFLSAKLISV